MGKESLSIIEEQVMPLVGTVKWEGFDKEALGSIMSLQSKLSKHVLNINKKKLRRYLALCVQEWPEVKKCPIDVKLLKQAIQALK